MGNHLTKTIQYKKNYYTSNRKSTMEFFYKFLLLTFLFIAINGRPQGQSNNGNRDPVHIGTLNGGNTGTVGGQHHHGQQGYGQHNYGTVSGNPVFLETLNGGNSGT